MALALANGSPVTSGHILMPATGAWTADLVVAAEESIAGKCTLAIAGGLTLNGTTFRSGLFEDTDYIRLVGGADGLRKPAKAKHYRNVSLSVVLRDLLAAAGETLSTTSDAVLLARQFPAYTQVDQDVGTSISALLGDRRLVDPVWRVLPDGTVWVGFETWPDAGVIAPDGYQEINNLPQQLRVELGFEAPTLLPGQSIEGRRVSYVEHHFDTERVRTVALLEN